MNTREPNYGDAVTTRWTVVVRATAGHDAEAADALNQLCQTYWPPVFFYVRMKGVDPCRAEDLTQDFFAWLLDRGHLAAANRERGKFRSFLLAYLQRFLANKRKRERAEKRGGGRVILSLNEEIAAGIRFEPSHSMTPERLFERQWALTLLESVMGRLQAECEAQGKGEFFGLAKAMISGDRDGFSYVEAAAQLGVKEAALRTAVSRLRTRHRQLLREAISDTLTDPEDVGSEIGHLLEVLSD